MYVALDRPELLCSSKAVASFMQSPTMSAMAKLTSVRHLLICPQAEWVYARRDVPKYLDVYGSERLVRRRGADRDLLEVIRSTQPRRRNRWSRCPARRRRFYACNCGTAGGMQTCHILTEVGYEVTPRVWSDSSACRGIVRRQRTGWLRYFGIRHMWTQERLQTEVFVLKAVPTDDNVADLTTKQWRRARVEELLSKLWV